MVHHCNQNCHNGSWILDWIDKLTSPKKLGDEQMVHHCHQHFHDWLQLCQVLWADGHQGERFRLFEKEIISSPGDFLRARQQHPRHEWHKQQVYLGKVDNDFPCWAKINTDKTLSYENSTEYIPPEFNISYFLGSVKHSKQKIQKWFYNIIFRQTRMYDGQLRRSKK